MLHILLLILKIIGIIIAAILGILVLLICIVLFVPLRYRVSGRCDGTLEGLLGEVKGSWLLHIVGVNASYKEKTLVWRIRIFWKTIAGSEEPADHSKGSKNRESLTKQKTVEGRKSNEEHEEVSKDSQEILETSSQKLEGDSQKVKEESQLPERIQAQRKKTCEDTEEEKSRRKKPVGEKIKDIFAKCKELIHKIKCTIVEFCDKIKALLKKKDKLKEFIQDDVHRRALHKVKTEMCRLLEQLKPAKVKADVRYGFEDPCLTGQVLAGLSMFYPFIGDHAVIRPDFEQKVLDGNLLIKGKIRVMYFAFMALRLFLCREVRTTYKQIKNFKF